LVILRTQWHFSRLCRDQEAVSADPEGYSKKAAMQKGEQLGLEAGTEAQLANSAADQNKVGTNPASAQGSTVASSTTSSPPVAAAGGTAEVEGGAPEEPSSPSSHISDESDTSDVEDAEFQT
jgi:hypothetical protein